jgi:hypothetical protein
MLLLPQEDLGFPEHGGIIMLLLLLLLSAGGVTRGRRQAALSTCMKTVG